MDYDLVIIGATSAGLEAALRAVSLKARVALVSQNIEPIANYRAFYSFHLATLGQWLKKWEEGEQFGFSGYVEDLVLRIAITWLENAIALIAEQNSPAFLSAAGVDFIVGSGEFCRRPQQAFVVEGRVLRSPAYLLAMDSIPILPELESVREVGYLTPDRLLQPQVFKNLPQDLAIVGGTALALELAQSLQRFDKTITFILEGEILPREEPEAARLILAQLEAEGVQILTNSPIAQAKIIQDKKWLQAGDNAIEVDEIIWAMGYYPNWDKLNLEAVGINETNYSVDAQLRTQNKSIYACGCDREGYSLPHLARYEAEIALHNALFWRRKQVGDRLIAKVMFVQPNFTRVGLTEKEARDKYGNKVVVYHRYFKQVPRGILAQDTTGFLKLILNPKGKILGATMVGIDAVESIDLLAFALQNCCTIEQLAQLFPVSPSWTEIIAQIARDWQCDRASQSPITNYFRRLWFNLRRRKIYLKNKN